MCLCCDKKICDYSIKRKIKKLKKLSKKLDDTSSRVEVASQLGGSANCLIDIYEEQPDALTIDQYFAKYISEENFERAVFLTANSPIPRFEFTNIPEWKAGIAFLRAALCFLGDHLMLPEVNILERDKCGCASRIQTITRPLINFQYKIPPQDLECGLVYTHQVKLTITWARDSDGEWRIALFENNVYQRFWFRKGEGWTQNQVLFSPPDPEQNCACNGPLEENSKELEKLKESLQLKDEQKQKILDYFFGK